MRAVMAMKREAHGAIRMKSETSLLDFQESLCGQNEPLVPSKDGCYQSTKVHRKRRKDVGIYFVLREFLSVKGLRFIL